MTVVQVLFSVTYAELKVVWDILGRISDRNKQ